MEIVIAILLAIIVLQNMRRYKLIFQAAENDVKIGDALIKHLNSLNRKLDK